MTRHIQLAAFAAAITATVALRPVAAQNRDSRADDVRSEIRKELLQLPYYSVFDFLAFKYDRGTVSLMGYAYAPALKADAERAVKRVPGVDTVQNAIEQLPPSQMDDDIRWRVYYAIYTDPFLSRYAPGGAMLWGHRHRFGGFAGVWGEGYEPAGNYPIHIIVRNGRVTLMGVVDNDGDKTIAGTKARQVPGTFEVKNELVVEKANSRRS
jgi:hyperosmotically inducible periplasmic protein